MRNLLALAIALSVNLTEDDVLELGYDATAEDFNAWFEIPEDAETVAGYKKHEDFDVKNLEAFMNAEEIASLAPATEEKAAPAAPAKETAKEKKARLAAEKEGKTENAPKTEKAPAATAEPKKPGVIASILNIITEAKEPVSEAQILEKLIVLFPEREAVAMGKTVKAQLGGKNQPLRMEDEKKVKFALTQTEVKEGKKSQRLYAIAK